MKLVGGHAPGQLAVVHRIPGPAHQNKREAQAASVRDRIASGAEAASSDSTASAATLAPAQILLTPLQQSISQPLASLQGLYGLALVADAPDKISRERLEFHVHFGQALRTLREDIPCFFSRPQNLEIFTDEVVFKDSIGPRLGLGPGIVYGKARYSRHLWALRLLASVAFSQCSVEVQRFWQRDDQTIAVRWVLQGSPRLLNAVTGTTARLDGISEFKFNSKGYIYQHTVDCINWDGLRLGLRQQSIKQEEYARVAGLC